jgi:hypothetical protein
MGRAVQGAVTPVAAFPKGCPVILLIICHCLQAVSDDLELTGLYPGDA